jgi:hypothetical protein
MHTVATLLSNASRSLPKVAPTPYRKYSTVQYEGHLPKECVAAVSLEPTSLKIANVIELNPLASHASRALPFFCHSSCSFVTSPTCWGVCFSDLDTYHMWFSVLWKHLSGCTGLSAVHPIWRFVRLSTKSQVLEEVVEPERTSNLTTTPPHTRLRSSPPISYLEHNAMFLC